MRLSSVVVTISVALSSLFIAAPAFATNGRQAVNSCIDRGSACTWTVDAAGGIDIMVEVTGFPAPALPRNAS